MHHPRKVFFAAPSASNIHGPLEALWRRLQLWVFDLFGSGYAGLGLRKNGAIKQAGVNKRHLSHEGDFVAATGGQAFHLPYPAADGLNNIYEGSGNALVVAARLARRFDATLWYRVEVFALRGVIRSRSKSLPSTSSQRVTPYSLLSLRKSSST